MSADNLIHVHQHRFVAIMSSIAVVPLPGTYFCCIQVVWMPAAVGGSVMMRTGSCDACM